MNQSRVKALTMSTLLVLSSLGCEDQDKKKTSPKAKVKISETTLKSFLNERINAMGQNINAALYPVNQASLSLTGRNVPAYGFGLADASKTDLDGVFGDMEKITETDDLLVYQKKAPCQGMEASGLGICQDGAKEYALQLHFQFIEEDHLKAKMTIDDTTVLTGDIAKNHMSLEAHIDYNQDGFTAQGNLGIKWSMASEEDFVASLFSTKGLSLEQTGKNPFKLNIPASDALFQMGSNGQNGRFYGKIKIPGELVMETIDENDGALLKLMSQVASYIILDDLEVTWEMSDAKTRLSYRSGPKGIQVSNSEGFKMGFSSPKNQDLIIDLVGQNLKDQFKLVANQAALARFFVESTETDAENLDVTLNVAKGFSAQIDGTSGLWKLGGNATLDMKAPEAGDVVIKDGSCSSSGFDMNPCAQVK